MSLVYALIETKHGYVGILGRNGILMRSTLPAASRKAAFEQITAGIEDSIVEDDAAFGDLPDRLRRYYSGEPTDFSDVKLDLSDYGPFHAAVLRAAQKVGYGQLVTYADLARMAGSGRAARAAGSAMARNMFPIIVPCHRVIASGGRIGGFSSGLEWKRSLLELEGVEL